MPEEMLTLDEVSRLLKMSKATVQRWCRDRRLPAAKIGKEYRIRREDLDRWYPENLAAGERQTRAA